MCFYIGDRQDLSGNGRFELACYGSGYLSLFRVRRTLVRIALAINGYYPHGMQDENILIYETRLLNSSFAAVA